MLTQKIETIRYELPYKSGLLVVDKTTFLNDIVDYELEFEVKDYNIGLEEFKTLLSEFNIEERKAKPKIARAMEYSKKQFQLLNLRKIKSLKYRKSIFETFLL